MFTSCLAIASNTNTSKVEASDVLTEIKDNLDGKNYSLCTA